MKLPAGLTPWAKHLQIFPDEISLTLGNYVQRISPFINPINALEEIPDGEPNGYDGVVRHGIYERLLLSELALADDYGDEFIRRAVMGEHLFLNLAKIDPGARRVTIALFDAGAMQIGTPRIAHLAAFIILARRAEAAGSMFMWGVLQDEKNLIISDDTESSIKILLESRVPPEVAVEDIERWRENLSEIQHKSDIWLIGSEDLARIKETKGFSHLYVDEVVDVEKREIILKIKSGSGVEKQTVLELPPPNVCTRLLRNPFEQIKNAAYSSAVLSAKVRSFFFDPTGSKLFTKLDSAEVSCFDVQNIPGGAKIQSTVYKSYDSKEYIAAGRLQKALAFASMADDQTVRLEYRKGYFKLKQGLYRTHAGRIAFPENKTELLQIFNLRPRNFHYDEAALLDSQRNLWLFNQIGQDSTGASAPILGTLMLSATDVLAVAQSDFKFLYIGCEDGNAIPRLISIGDKIERHSLPVNKPKQAFFGRGEQGKKVIAFEDESGSWSILDEDDNLRLMPKPDGEVVGVYKDSRFAPTAGLFELLPDKRTVKFTWGHGRGREILRANEEIIKIEFSPRSPIFAYQTAGGELIIFSLTHRTVIGRYSK